jgi:hypothetical protein
MNEETDARGDQNHQQRERVEIKTDFRPETRDVHPGPENLSKGAARRRRHHEAGGDHNCHHC